MTELFPKADELGTVRFMSDGAEVVAFDLDGDRYCVECAMRMDEIDCERFHNEPRTVPHGGSVERRHMAETDHEYHCGNTDCGRKIPTPDDVR